MTIEAVKCIKCGKLHEVDSETYFKLDGTLYIGDSGGLYGPNTITTWCLYCLIASLLDFQKQAELN
jgi:hypothetical protein